jgi:acyl-CoA thioesterase
MMVSRMTVELLRPVPMAPLDVAVALLRPGRKVQLIQSTIVAGGLEVARAQALRIRQIDLPLEATPAVDGMSPDPEASRKTETLGFRFGANFDIRVAQGSGIARPGPTAAWFRLLNSIVEGEEPSPLMRVMAAADFGNGISHELEFSEHIFINPDLTVYLHRYPHGEWVCLDARTVLSQQGIGMAESRLYDELGLIGRSVQSLVLERRAVP